MSTSTSSSRRSSRKSESDEGDGKITKMHPLKSIRRIEFCTEWPLPRELMCNGCSEYCNSPMFTKIEGKDRAVTHSHVRFICKQPWKNSPDEYDLRYDNLGGWIAKVHAYIETTFDTSARRLIVEKTPTTHSVTKRALAETDQQEESPVSSLSEGSETGQPTKKPKEDVQLKDFSVNSQGHTFDVEGIPLSHVVVHKSQWERLKNIEKQVKDVQAGMSNHRFDGTGSSHLMHTMIGVALSSCPALPISQAAAVMPLITAAFLVDAGILHKTDVMTFSKSFPSESYLRHIVFCLAAENSYELGQRLKNKLVFMSCDKGNKKGVGHVMKILSWWEEGQVHKQCLDMDASEGSTEQCAYAIAASLKKIGSIRLQGQTTDSGGGGVLDGLAHELHMQHVTRPNYLIASCSLHNLQLAVANPIKMIMGDGGLDKKNVMQLIHSVYDLQKSMDKELWKTHCHAACMFLNAHVDTVYYGVTAGDKLFASKWEKVKSFRHFQVIDEVELKKTIMKVPAPVLTRWWTVGETARVAWDAYLLMYRVCQQVINATGTGARSNKIASALQSLLLEEELFSDLAMLHNYHTFFVVPHFDWMQSATDMTHVPGFQSHNTLARYFLLIQDLWQLKTTLLIGHAGFSDFRKTLARLPRPVQQQQRTKSIRFIDCAVDAIEKHFNRWSNPQLLPAALLAEDHVAYVVACVMTNRPLPPTAGSIFTSKVHGRTIDLSLFYHFILQRVQRMPNRPPYEYLAFHAANLLIGGYNFRDKANLDPYKHFLYTTYLPLASHTQFVEAGVKEAKLVSCTDRSEALRSAYAVNRSARVHNEKLRDLTISQRVEWLLKTTKEHVDGHEVLRQQQPNYNERVEDIAKLMRSQHYRDQRLQKVKDDALEKLNNNKKDNAVQLKSGVDRTFAVEGLFPYGKLVKKLHFDALKVELMFRGCTEDEVKQLGITQMKNKLKELEIQRVADGNNTKEKETALKAFKPLSTALFPDS